MKQKMEKGKKHTVTHGFQKVNQPNAETINEGHEKEKAILRSKLKFAQAIKEL